MYQLYDNIISCVVTYSVNVCGVQFYSISSFFRFLIKKWNATTNFEKYERLNKNVYRNKENGSRTRSRTRPGFSKT